ncbi:type I polyketide synthase [Streptomyces phaeofaciens]|uniref:type I polyketide synthase n=1 Tax=Streptomyces phaeofaciens TaxID=68254 RepID=UPI0036CB3F96
MSQDPGTTSPSAVPADAVRPAASAPPIAVIGLACRFPGARTPDAFWHNLLQGRDSVTRPPGAAKAAARGLLEDPEWFDAHYFGISPAQARVVNPQHRLFLECAVEALEDAGCDPARHHGTVGVYAGAGENAYAQLVKASQARSAGVSGVSDWEIRLANGPDFLCSRVAHKLGLHGPAVTVQAACATSLVAVHLAVRGLSNGDCDLALAGGVTVRVPSPAGSSDEMGIQAPDGVCRAFDADARGLVGGDGAGVVVLKRLADALADGDRVDAVVRGSAVNNDGGGGIGFTAPGVDGQAAVIESAQRAAGVDADSFGYVETHGTGTPLGDPAEVAALTKAFRRTTDRRGFCWIGSVKTNIGHTDAAAGVAGLIKTVLALKHGMIPPSLHFRTPNPGIDFESSPFRVIDEPREWPRGGLPRRAGVSSFGAGGTNAHVVLEQATPRAEPPPHSRTWQMLPLSAKTPGALAVAADRLAGHLRTHPGTPLTDVAWTLQTGRREHGFRGVVLVDSAADAVRALTGERPDGLRTAPAEVRPRPVVLRFPAAVDAPAEHGRWARAYEDEPEFRADVDACGAGDELGALVARVRAGRDTAPGDEGESTALIAFAGRYAAARWWQRWGVVPDEVLGEGPQALVAAVVAGVLPAADAARLAVAAAGGAPADRLAELMRRVGLRAPALVLRTAPGARRTSSAEATDPAYWAACLHRSAAATGAVSVGPYPSDRARPDVSTGWLPSSECDALGAVGQLWLSGARIDWAATHRGARPRRVALPTYPFERRRYTVVTEDTAVSDEPARPAAPARSGPPAPSGSASESGTVDVVAGLFAEILDLPEVEPDESFFDLGGDSLIATRFVARVREVLPVDLAPRTLFEAPTAAELAALIDARTGLGGPP